jgi:predicted acylesterase/phospholipase RssA
LNFVGALVAALVILSGCVARDVGPINTVSSEAPPPTPKFIPDGGDDGSTVMALAFSGGGMRASAFAFGVLTALDDIVVDEAPYRRSMVDNIRMISGVSGGAVVAAYFGYKGRDDYRDLDRKFLYRDPESAMQTSMTSPVAISRALAGGINDRTSFARWLDRNLFDHAHISSFRWPNAPTVWINASDIFNRTPFLFTYDTFAALCSDLDKVSISDAVAASAAFPVVFSPLVLEAKRTRCRYERPGWLTRALADPRHSIRLQAYAEALDAYQSNTDLNYVRLLDGGLTDNLGITGFVLERAAADTPHGPLSAEEAVKLRHFIFAIADAGRGQTETWGQDMANLPIGKLLMAGIDTSMSASLRDEVDALRQAVSIWRDQLVRYRCGLPIERVRRIRGTAAGWNCRDVNAIVEHLSFSDLDPETARELNTVATRLTLPKTQVEKLVSAGRQAVARNNHLAAAVADIRKHAGVVNSQLVSQR